MNSKKLSFHNHEYWGAVFLMIHYIYSIRNKINNKMYIGLTNNFRRRRNRHFTDLRCQRHDNRYLQNAFNKYGEENFEFMVLLETRCSREEINKIEEEYISKYNTFKNGYNLNSGGFQNNGFESKLNESDVFNILSVLEFGEPLSGGALASIYEVSRTTISRIKRGESHKEYKIKYESLDKKSRESIYQGFCKDVGFKNKKNKSIRRINTRKFDKNTIFMILSVFDFDNRKIKPMAEKLSVAPYTISSIRDGLTYKFEKDLYNSLSQNEKVRIYDEALNFFEFNASSYRNVC